MAEKQISILLIAKNMASKTIGQVNKDLDKLGRKGANFGKVGKGLATIGAVAGGAVAVGLYKSAQAAIEWQDAFQGVVKTVDETDLRKAGSSFEELGTNLRDMAREMPNTAIELAGIAEQAGALGIKATDIEAFTRQVAILASTTNITADEAATALGQLQNVIGLTGDEFDNFAASLVDLGNKGASTEGQILEIARRSGAAAKLFGIAKDETLGWAAAAANLGMNEELAGTSLQYLFLKSMNNFARGENKMGEFMGMSDKAMKKAFGKDASGMLTKFIKKLAALPKDARLEAIQSFFGRNAGLTRLVLGLTDSVDKNLTPSLQTSTTAWEQATAAQVEFDKRSATVKSQLQILKNNITDAAISVGEGFAPAIGRAAAKLSEFLKVPGNRSALQNLGKDIGRVIDGVDWGGLIRDARSFMSALEKAGGFARGLWDAFMAMPTEVKAILISLAGLEKVSGGAVSSIVGELGKGLIKGVLGITAAVVNVNGGVVNGGGKLPIPGGGGGGGGGINPLPAAGGLLAPGIATLGAGIGAILAMWALPAIVAELNKDKPKPKGLVTKVGTLTPQQVDQMGMNIPNYANLAGKYGNAKTPVGSKPPTMKLPDTDRRVDKLAADTRSEGIAQRRALEGLRSQQAANAVTFANALSNQPPPQVNVSTNVKVNVTAANVTRAIATRTRIGPTGGSRSQPGHPGGGGT